MQPPTDTFTHNHKIYDLTKVRLLVRPEKAFLLPIYKLLWVLDHDTPDPERVKLAKHRYPLLVSRWNNRWTIVDGLHRLEKYRQKHITVVPVKEVTEEMLIQAEVKHSS